MAAGHAGQPPVQLVHVSGGSGREYRRTGQRGGRRLRLRRRAGQTTQLLAQLLQVADAAADRRTLLPILARFMSPAGNRLWLLRALLDICCVIPLERARMDSSTLMHLGSDAEPQVSMTDAIHRSDWV